MGVLPGRSGRFGADLAGREALAVLAAAPTPDQGRRLSQARLESLLRKAGRQRNVTATAAKIRASLASEQLTARPKVVSAYAASASALIVVLSAMATQTEVLAGRCRGTTSRVGSGTTSRVGLGRVIMAWVHLLATRVRRSLRR